MKYFLILAGLAVAAIAGMLVFVSDDNASDEDAVNALDEAAVKAVIEEFYPLQIEACLDSNHGNVQQFKAAFANFASDATRTPSRLATRTANYNKIYLAADPDDLATDVAEARAMATGSLSNMPSEKLDTIAGYSPPTPFWDPADTMLEEFGGRLDSCQSLYGNEGSMAHAFGLNSFTYNSVDLSGSVAVVDVSIDGWTEWAPNGGYHSEGISQFIYELEKKNGVWKITNQAFMPGLP